MRKKIFIIATISALLVCLVYFIVDNYDLSADYNYVTAKVDIKNGYVKIICIGLPPTSEKEIEPITERYGFKNVYIEKLPPNQGKKGIKDYNEVVEQYLVVRNGVNWKVKYEKEIDSLLDKK